MDSSNMNIKTGYDLIMHVGKTLFSDMDGKSHNRIFAIQEPQDLKMYQNLYAYLAQPEISARIGLNQAKGLGVFGPVGTGKTIMMRVMQQLYLKINDLCFRRMRIMPVSEFLHAFKEDESAAFREYGYDFKHELCIDELGWEATHNKHYGRESTLIIAELLNERYRLFQDTGTRTHFTTNVRLVKEKEGDALDLYDLYGDRTIDRIKEMINVFNVSGKSKRV